MAKKKGKTSSSPPKAKRPPKAQSAKGVERRQWAALRKQLIEKRAATLQAMKKISDFEVSNEVGDEADQAGQSLEKELQFELSDNERNQLDQIEGALRKMDKGTYGLCEQCQKEIPKPRIEALPFARYCIACQGSAERASLT